MSKDVQTTCKARWDDNNFYSSDDNTSSIENKIDSNYKVEPLYDKEPMVPDWLKKRKEMVYPPKCVEKGRQLGSGQFGAVFMGKLTQGTAMYVFLFYLLFSFTLIILKSLPTLFEFTFYNSFI